MRYHTKYMRVLLVFQGGGEYKNVDFAMRPFVEWLEVGTPCAEAARTPDTGHVVYDAHRRTRVRHYSALAYVQADTPAMAVFNKTSGHSGFTGCNRCAFRGSTDPRGGSSAGREVRTNSRACMLACSPQAQQDVLT